MAKSIDRQANSTVTIVGTLQDVNIREGETKADRKPYRAGTATVRVNQVYNNKEEVSEIPVSFIAMKYKKDGTANPAYDSVSQLKNEFKTIQQVGAGEATRVRLTGNGVRINENLFVDSRNPENVVSSWKVNTSFFNRAEAQNSDCATFSIDIFIMSINREMTAEGEETGRLKIRGGVVKYGRKLDVLEFIVEEPTTADYIERNWSMGDTVNAIGRIRYTSEQVTYHSENTWGEAIPQTSTKSKRELVITYGSDFPFDEENAYDPQDIKTLTADRNMYKEQLKMNARSKATTPKATATHSSGFEWEE